MKASVILDKSFQLAQTDEHLFCSFVEPLGRCIYGGIYEPGHPTADANGFRQDVLSYVKALHLTMNRFPGGNYTSTFRWEDSIGPKDQRPRRAEVAWQCIEDNEFGLNEFAQWSKENGSDVMMTVNLATRGVLEAMDCVEYCNFEKGTYWSELRRAHGYDKPHGYQYWCLSNELDGVWQVGQTTGRAYGQLAREASKAMKLLDPKIKTVLAGSSNPFQDTFPTFDHDALDEAYDFVDFISIHQYFSNAKKDTPNYLAKSLSTDRYFKDIGAVIDYVKAKKRSSHQVYISFDEYNTWHTVAGNERFEKPKWGRATPLLEDEYTVVDAVALGTVLITILRNADRVRIACLSELVNAISHIRTRTGGGCWVLPAYYTFLHYCTYARGTVLNCAVDSPCYNSRDYENVPYLECTAVLNDGLTIFAVNRSLEESLTLEAELRGFDGENYRLVEQIVIADDDPQATNTEECPNRVTPRRVTGAAFKDGKLCAKLEKLSWNVIRFEKA